MYDKNQPVTNNEQEQKDVKPSRRKWIKFIARVGIFGAIASLFYIIPVPPFNFPIFSGSFSFLKIHIEEVPALVAGFAYGPLAGVAVLIIKTLVKLPMSGTGGIGELGDLVYSIGFIVPAVLVYKQNRKFKGAILGLGIGFFTQLAFSTIFNFYVIFPLYKELYKLPFERDAFIAWAIPFNAIKNVIVIALTLLVYKSAHRLVEKI